MQHHPKKIKHYVEIFKLSQEIINMTKKENPVSTTDLLIALTKKIQNLHLENEDRSHLSFGKTTLTVRDCFDNFLSNNPREYLTIAGFDGDNLLKGNKNDSQAVKYMTNRFLLISQELFKNNITKYVVCETEKNEENFTQWCKLRKSFSPSTSILDFSKTSFCFL